MLIKCDDFVNFIADFIYGDYGIGLYFSKFPSKATKFSAVSTLAQDRHKNMWLVQVMAWCHKATSHYLS